MGEVYRALDTTLKRPVAIKVLPAAVASDPERLARFRREAEVLASLNHPNIAQIYGTVNGPSRVSDAERNPRDASGGSAVHALVMELVEGPTLADRIAQGPMAVEEALPIARQIAEALEAAHGQGIVHRDLKPANIKVRPDATVKVLDFGLAKAMERSPAAAPPPADVTASPTITSPVRLGAGYGEPGVTGVGVILGTAAYMSPEQACRRPVDHRSDIWAFGVVLFEMLAGRRPFEGDEVTALLAGVLKSEPGWDALPADTPLPIRRLLRRCLEKEPRRRLQHIGDARLEIEEAPRETPSGDVRLGRRRAAVSAAVALLAGAPIGAAILWLLWSGETRARAPQTYVEAATPPTTDPVSFEISPDGRQLVFVASNGGTPRLWLRTLSAPDARPLPGTEHPSAPFWSPDSESIGFIADGWLKRIDVRSNVVQVVARSTVPAGASWSRDGTIVYPLSPSFDIMRVSAGGGTPRPVARLVEGASSHTTPHFLRDGRHFLYFVTGNAPPVRGIYAASLDGGSPTRLLDADSPAQFAAGHLFYERQSTLFAQPFDPVRLKTSGDAVVVAEGVARGSSKAAFSVSDDGTIAYRTGSSGSRRQLVWFDRDGREVDRVGEPETRGNLYPAMSPSARRLAVQRLTSRENTGIWILDLGRPTPTPFSDDAATSIAPIWSPDESSLVYGVQTGRVFDLFVRRLGETGTSPLLKTEQSKQAVDWSRDGRFVLFRSSDSETNRDIWALPVQNGKAAGEPIEVVSTPSDERHAQFSPDGRWVAYQSDQSGRFEVWVQGFPAPGERRRVSGSGGTQVRWREDGRELFYIRPDGQLVAVGVKASADGQRLEFGAEVPLFAVGVGALQDLALPHYVVARDGQRFLLDRLVEEPAAPITLILNWDGRSRERAASHAR